MTARRYAEIARRYDEIAGQYKASKALPFREHVEDHSLSGWVGPLAGASVLDLACGDGHYTRHLKEAGAAKVLGVDISARMIALAEARERAQPLGCRYRQGNVAELALGERFDLAVAAYLLNYASSKAMLLELCRPIFDHLKPGGRFIGLNTNMDLDPKHYGGFSNHGFKLTAPPERREGDPIEIEITNPDGSCFGFENRYLHPETYEAAFAEAGFLDFAWLPVTVSAEARHSDPPEHWEAVLQGEAFVTGFSARRSCDG